MEGWYVGGKQVKQASKQGGRCPCVIRIRFPDTLKKHVVLTIRPRRTQVSVSVSPLHARPPLQDSVCAKVSIVALSSVRSASVTHLLPVQPRVERLLLPRPHHLMARRDGDIHELLLLLRVRKRVRKRIQVLGRVRVRARAARPAARPRARRLVARVRARRGHGRKRRRGRERLVRPRGRHLRLLQLRLDARQRWRRRRRAGQRARCRGAVAPERAARGDDGRLPLLCGLLLWRARGRACTWSVTRRGPRCC